VLQKPNEIKYALWWLLVDWLILATCSNLLSEYGNFTFFPSQNMVTLPHFYPQNSFVGLALPKICGENLTQKIKCCLQYE
jgi:hypothetical protein